MKQVILHLFLIFSVNLVSAQWSENNAIYHSSELSMGNYLGIDLNANYVLREKYSFKIGYSGFLRKPHSAPENYSSGFIGAILFGLANPYDQLGNFQLLAGKIYLLNKKGTIRANLSLGIGYAAIKEPINWQPVEGSFITQNYSFDYNRYHTLSLIINPKIEFPFTRFYGLSLSPLIQVNKDRIYYGIGIGQMIGLLRKKTNEKPEEAN